MDFFCYLCFVCVMLSCLYIAVLWSPAGKPLWCPGSGVVLDCINSRSLPSYLLLSCFTVAMVTENDHQRWVKGGKWSFLNKFESFLQIN